MEIALYGVPESGPLCLWLPLKGDRMDHYQEHDRDDDLTAYKSNKKRPLAARQLDSDLSKLSEVCWSNRQI